jgi:hypothetical protein
MYAQPLSVPDAVRDVLARNQTYLQALELGIANYTAVAEKIKPDIEKFIGAKVNLNTIVVAIKRIADAIEKEEKKKSDLQQGKENKSAFGAKPKLSLIGSMIDIDFQRNVDDGILENLLNEFFERNSRYNLFQTDSHFTLLTEDADEIRNIVADAIEKFNGKISEGLSKITISLSQDEENPYHLLSLISNILYNYQIPIHSAFFVPNEIVLALNEKDAAKAYDLIRVKLA